VRVRVYVRVYERRQIDHRREGERERKEREGGREIAQERGRDR
jgi:hypothetical protein